MTFIHALRQGEPRHPVHKVGTKFPKLDEWTYKNIISSLRGGVHLGPVGSNIRAKVKRNPRAGSTMVVDGKTVHSLASGDIGMFREVARPPVQNRTPQQWSDTEEGAAVFDLEPWDDCGIGTRQLSGSPVVRRFTGQRRVVVAVRRRRSYSSTSSPGVGSADHVAA